MSGNRTLIVAALLMANWLGIPVGLTCHETAAADDWEGAYPEDSSWEELAGADKLHYLELVRESLLQNEQRIRTWRGSYQERSSMTLPAEVTAIERSGDAVASGVATTFEARHEFVLDSREDRLFTELVKVHDEYLLDDGRPAKMKVGRSPVVREVLTLDEYLTFSPADNYGRFGALRHVEQPSRKAAFRRASSTAEHTLFSNSLDPRQLYRSVSTVAEWQQYELLINLLRGGGEGQRETDAILKVSHSRHGEREWVRLAIYSGGSKWPMKECIHDSAAGFHLTRMTEWNSRTSPDDRPRLLYRWRYQQQDGIHVPATVELQYDDLKHARRFDLESCEFNVDVADAMFTVAALRLDDNQLFMDDVNRIAYVMQEGELVKLTDYASIVEPTPAQDVRYQPIAESSASSAIPEGPGQNATFRYWILGLNGLAVVAIVIVWFVLRRKKSNC